MSSLDNFLSGQPGVTDQKPSGLEERVLALEQENYDLKKRVAAVEQMNGKLLQAVEKMISERQVVRGGPPSVSPSASSVPYASPYAKHAPSHALSWSSPASPPVKVASVSSPAAPASAGLKREREEDPVLLDRSQLGSRVAGKQFPRDFEEHLNAVKKDLRASDVTIGPLQLARDLYCVAKDDVHKFVPPGDSHFDFGCKYIHSIYHAAKKLKGAERQVEIETGDDIDEDGGRQDLTVDLEVLADSLPRTAAPKTTTEPDVTVVLTWKDKVVDELGIPASDDSKELGNEALTRVANSAATKVSEEQALGIINRLREVGLQGWYKFLMRDQYQWMSFAGANAVKIQFCDAATRLLKLLLHVAVHNAITSGTTESLMTTMAAIQGKTLDDKVQRLLATGVSDKKKTSEVIIFTLLELVGRRIAGAFTITLNGQALSQTSMTSHVEQNLQAPTRSSSVEKVLHLLMAATLEGHLDGIKPIAVHILGAIFKFPNNDVIQRVCPDGVIPKTFKAASMITF